MLDILFYDNKMFYKIPYTKDYYYINDDYEVISVYNSKKIKYLKYYMNKYYNYLKNQYYSLITETGKRIPINKHTLLKRAKEQLATNRLERERYERWLKEHGLYKKYIFKTFK